MPLKTQIDEPPSFNLTSMIDVVFLLVIFFMVATRFSGGEQKIALSVPSVGNVSGLPPVAEKQSINIFRDGSVALGKDVVTDSELLARLKAERKRNPKLSVIVRGDSEVPLQRLAGVLATCRQSGVSEIGMSVRLAQKER